MKSVKPVSWIPFKKKCFPALVPKAKHLVANSQIKVQFIATVNIPKLDQNPRVNQVQNNKQKIYSKEVIPEQ